MGLIVREIVGWALVAFGLVLVGFVLHLALGRRVIESVAVALPAVVIFRSGIGLVRLATAGRIALRLDADDHAHRRGPGERGK